MTRQKRGGRKRASAYAKLIARLKTISHASSIMSLLFWDQQTQMPAKGAESRSNQIAFMGQSIHKLSASASMRKLIENAEAELSQLDETQTLIVEMARENFDLAARVPASFMTELTQSVVLAQQAWVQAKAENSFALFQPHLEKLVQLSKRRAKLLDKDAHPYDALLTGYEKGMTTEKLRVLFADLKKELVALNAQVAKNAEAVDDTCLKQTFDVVKQQEFCRTVTRALGLDPANARLEVSVHPFCSGIASPHDVRLTTRFNPDRVTESILAACHETGHALYELGKDPHHAGTPLGKAASMGMHESQSRLWENFVARSREFWSVWYPRLQEAFPTQLANVSLTEFHRAMNKSGPSFIRVTSDELTYNLHIILRFELEIDLIEGKIAVADLPRQWNDRFESMFGIRPPSDREGVLQDVHWSTGSFGYFPTYTVGNLISAQLWESVLAAHPEIPQEIANGQYGTLLGWLRENVHVHGSRYSTPELVQRATGNEISCDAFIRQMKLKYGELYRLED